LIRLQKEPVEAGVIRIPGGKPAALALAVVGLVATTAVIVGSIIPDASEPNKTLAVVKIVVLSAVLLGGGAGLYAVGKWKGRAQRPL
jgi:hypothetical protein